MAVYEGARAQPLLLPRRQQPNRTRRRRRSGSVGLGLAAILVVFLVALFYLSHTIHLASTRFDLDRLATERTRLQRELTSMRGEIARWGAEPAIVDGAQQAGIGRLGEGIRLPAR
jgi:hypothetical protein